jgi:transposase
MSKNIYTKEFKLRAIELLKQSSKPIRQIARELGVGENNLYNWRKQF